MHDWGRTRRKGWAKFSTLAVSTRRAKRAALRRHPHLARPHSQHVTKQRAALFDQLVELALGAADLLVQVFQVLVDASDLIAQTFGFSSQTSKSIQCLMPEPRHPLHLRGGRGTFAS